MSLVRFTKNFFRDNPGYTPKHLYFKLWDKTSKITPEQGQIDPVTGKITGEYTYTHRDQDNNEQKYTGHVVMNRYNEYDLHVNYRSNHSMKQRILPLYVILQNEYREEDIESIIHENSQYFDFSQSKKRSRQESTQKTKRQKTISSSHTRSYPNVKYRDFVIEDGEHRRIRLVFKYNGKEYILHQIRVKERDTERIIIDPHELDSITSTEEFMKKMKGIRYINHTMSHSRGGGKRKSTYKKHINF